MKAIAATAVDFQDSDETTNLKDIFMIFGRMRCQDLDLDNVITMSFYNTILGNKFF